MNCRTTRNPRLTLVICVVANSQAAPGENKGNNLPISILVRLVSKLLGALYILCAQDFFTRGKRPMCFFNVHG